MNKGLLAAAIGLMFCLGAGCPTQTPNGGGDLVTSDIQPGTYAGTVTGTSFVDFTTDDQAGTTQQTTVTETRQFNEQGVLLRQDGQPVAVGDVRQGTFGAQAFTETVLSITGTGGNLTVNLSVTLPLDTPGGPVQATGVAQEFYAVKSDTQVDYSKIIFMNEPTTVIVNMQWAGTLAR